MILALLIEHCHKWSIYLVKIYNSFIFNLLNSFFSYGIYLCGCKV